MEHEQEGLPLSSLREISILKSLKHENIVQVIDVVVGRQGLDNIFMVMEYCEHDMAFLMDNAISKGPGYSPSQIKCLMSQLLLGVSYMHSKFIIHRDLKLSNLLLTAAGVLKIADFGLARRFGLPIRAMTPRVVTLWYRAPELLFGAAEYTTSIDIWSVGCIFGEFILSKPIMPGKSEINQIRMIVDLLGSPSERLWPGFSKLPHVNSLKIPHVEYDSVSATFPDISEFAKILLKRMLTYWPDARITSSQALESSYFKEFPRACPQALLPTFPEFRNNVLDSSKRATELDDKKPKLFSYNANHILPC